MKKPKLSVRAMATINQYVPIMKRKKPVGRPLVNYSFSGELCHVDSTKPVTIRIQMAATKLPGFVPPLTVRVVQ